MPRPRQLGRLAALLLVGLAAPARGQEIRESDLYFSDTSNLARLVDEASAACRDGRTAIALDKVESVLAASAAGEAGATDALVVRAHLLRAELRFANGQSGEAEADLVEALRIAPAANPDPAAPAKFLKLFGTIRKRSIGALSVRSDPAGATVFLNGRELGATPLTAAPAPLGTQFLRITRVGYEAVDREITVDQARIAEVSMVLRRRSATFLLMTNADPTEVRLDGELVGTATRPTPAEVDELVTTFNLPIDPYAPSPLLLLRDAPTGQHVIELQSPCHTPIRRIVEIPAGTDSTSLVPLEPAHGTLRVTGPLDVEISIDGVAAGVPPVVNDRLCPGTHLVEVVERSGQKTQVTVVVTAANQTDWAVRFRPVLALLTDDRTVRDGFLTLEPWNVVLPAGLASANPNQLLDGSGVNADRVSRLVAAYGATLIAWIASTDLGREVYLLAATASAPERIPLVGPDDLGKLLASLGRSVPLYQQETGIALVDTRLLDHPIVAAMAEGANGAGLRIGDEILAIGDAEVGDVRAFDRIVGISSPGQPLSLRVRRPAGEYALSLPVERTLGPLEYRAIGLTPSASIAQLEDLIRTARPDDTHLTDLRFALGRAYAELGDWPQAYAALQGAHADELARRDAGRLLLYRGIAALAVGARRAATEALRGALSYPEARPLGLDAGFVRTEVEPLLDELELPEPSD